ncbi:MAG: hypothetical protein M1821_009874 [Bathelium mastoideum]|nr:MAG: hypothetical protein M1821_009874 [Bathelium mastoideum]KAI9690368.1 MAG: hypothetical protein M1822_009330 [Bathelium mastoideum]
MASISIGDALAIVDKAVELYNRIHDAPEKIKEIMLHVKRMKPFLEQLRDLLADKSENSLAQRYPLGTSTVNGALEGVKKDVDLVNTALEQWQAATPTRLKKALQALGGKPDKIEKLSRRIDQQQQDIQQYLSLLTLYGINTLVQAIPPAGVTLESASLPRAKDESISIMFIDTYNRGRSRIGEGYAKLVREWTTRTNNVWKITTIASAGFRIRNGSDCVDILQALRIRTDGGNKQPLPIPMDSLFDNHFFKHKYRDDIQNELLQSKSRGVTTKLFSTYDYIFTYTQGEGAKLEGLRDALVNRLGPSAAPAGKGNIVLLGKYGLKKEHNIDSPNETDDLKHNREVWNQTTSNIKMSFRGFLEKELGWTKPPKGGRRQ